MTVTQLVKALKVIEDDAGDLPVVRDNTLGVSVHGTTATAEIQEVHVVIDDRSERVRVVLS